MATRYENLIYLASTIQKFNIFKLPVEGYSRTLHSRFQVSKEKKQKISDKKIQIKHKKEMQKRKNCIQGGINKHDYEKGGK